MEKEINFNTETYYIEWIFLNVKEKEILDAYWEV